MKNSKKKKNTILKSREIKRCDSDKSLKDHKKRYSDE